MTVSDFNQLVETRGESPNLDFKGDCPWDAQSMAKDFIAMANTRGGGSIVIGVAESDSNSFVKVGISEEHLLTYNSDLMHDKLVRYIDPPISFKVIIISEVSGMKFVVINISEFSEVPSISKTNLDGKLKANTLYVRTKSGRPASVPINNASDFKDVVELAALKLIQRRRDFGWSMESASAGLSKSARPESPSPLLSQIRSRGYWRIEFFPLVSSTITPLGKCLTLVEKSQVRLNWSFPWIPRNRVPGESVHPGDDCYEAESDWGERKEFWRMFQSEEFELFSAIREDWLDRSAYQVGSFSNVSEKPLGLIGTVYTMFTQTFEFVAGLHRNGLYTHGVKVSVTMPSSRDRQLFVDRDNRNDFYEARITRAQEISIETVLTVEQLQDTRSESNAAIRAFLQYFNFYPSADSIKIEQDKILSGN
ncbi:AlbA family DNA-binding domain-containing protein [Dyadobacter sp. 22481]|uniref:AlbA family DNA-binding domain-containing protein n=1 Tax=Dyadobacter sp. 22481 TaxID=3453926 RepID=UPI003F868C5E